jgi:5-methylcytosine-specific restriction endonuclease McrA
MEVKRTVWDRDGGRCVICGTTRMTAPNAHFIPRSALGLGIEENIVTLCMPCHVDYDNSPKRQEYREIIRRYLKMRYKDWDESKLVYKKYPAFDNYLSLSDEGKTDVDRYIEMTMKGEHHEKN